MSASSLVTVTYQRTGSKAKTARARFDLAVVPDPRGWIEARLGELADFEMTNPEPAAGCGRRKRRTWPASWRWRPDRRECSAADDRRPPRQTAKSGKKAENRQPKNDLEAVFRMYRMFRGAPRRAD